MDLQPCADTAESIFQGYDVARWDPMGRQQGDEHAEPCDGEENIQQPGQKLEGVGRPTPAVGAGAERHSGPLQAVVSNWRCAVRVLGAYFHPSHRNIQPLGDQDRLSALPVVLYQVEPTITVTQDVY